MPDLPPVVLDVLPGKDAPLERPAEVNLPPGVLELIGNEGSTGARPAG
ncbi:MAG: hypothetical protein U0835_17060 [Isosphaeraceae bacterium]